MHFDSEIASWVETTRMMKWLSMSYETNGIAFLFEKFQTQ
jgi:hypothetical protein